MKFTIRITTRADLAAVDALLARVYPRLLKPDYPPSVLVLALPIISRARPELVSSGTYYLAEDRRRRVLGAGGWSRDRTAAGLGHIRHVVTDDRVLRRGVGRAIVGHALVQARAAGIGRMECLATRMAVPFYRAMGFAGAGPVGVPLGPGIVFPAVRMIRTL